MLPVELIQKRKRGETHSHEELAWLVKSYTDGSLPDYQMAAWLMAANFQRLSVDESFYLTQEMKKSGQFLEFPSSVCAVDKHSTGGVGDKASLILGPIAAACGAKVPMITGRGLGHTGGTTDKLESIPGYSTAPALDEFKKTVLDLGICIIGQTPDICPADRKIYGLRDVTGTVENIPLICSSILSKKLAEGIRALVMDVKYGSGAFMSTLDDAKNLAKALIQIGNRSGIDVVANITDMNQPLGRYVGNSLEILETIEVLKGENLDQYKDTVELSLVLASQMIHLSGNANDEIEARKLAEKALKSGAAFSVFEKMCARMGGTLSALPTPKFKTEMISKFTGYVSKFNARELGMAAISIGAGRKSKSDQLDLTSGFYFHKKLGDSVSEGETLVTIFGSNESLFNECKNRLNHAIQI
ncbi:MAG: thymidine phosphorylase [Bdellovibrionales bacterium]|nr:thymidine phosphorylase [Bdellovibrionales bacterium]